MQNDEQIFKMLGFANRARKLTFGMSATLQALKRGKIQYIIMASDVSDNAQRKISSAIVRGKTPIHKFSNKMKLGEFFGRTEIGILGIVDAGFAKSIKNILG